MKFKILLYIACSFFFIQADNYHNTLLIPGVVIDNPFWEFDHQRIHQKEEGLFAALVEKWNQRLDFIWKKLACKIREEIRASTIQVDYYMEDQRFIDAYMNHYRQVFADIIDHQETCESINPFILNFLRGKLNYLNLHKPVHLHQKNSIPFFAISFGTDQQDHYLVINENNFDTERINEIYELAISNTTKFHIEPPTQLHLSRIIEYCNFFHLIMTQCLSSIIHQNDYFSKILMIFIFNKKTLTTETQNYGANYTMFQSYLEACLQAKNPLEVAIFVEPFIANSCHHDYKPLWQEFIEDLENCYNEQDLAAYQARALQERRAALFTQNDN